MNPVRILCLSLVLAAAAGAQITKQPEFDQRDKFRGSQVEMAIDSDSHTSGMRGAAASAMLNRFLRTEWESAPRLAEVREHLKKQDYTAASKSLAGAPATAAFEIARAVAAVGLGDAAGAVAPLCSALRAGATALDFVGDLLELNPGQADCLRRYLAGAARQPDPGSRVLYLYALALLRTEPADPKSAESTLIQATRAAPPSAFVWLELGKLQSTPGHEPEAIAALEQAVQLDPALAQAHYRLAQLYRRTGKPDQASAHLEAWRKAGSPR